MSDSNGNAPAGLRVPVGGKWARSALALRKLSTKTHDWQVVDGKCGRTTAEQLARRYNLALSFNSPWEFGYIEAANSSELWVRFIGQTEAEREGVTA